MCYCKWNCPFENHATNCKKNPNNIDKRQKLLDLESRTHRSDDGSIETVTIPRLREFNQDVIRKALSNMLVVDELPFSFVEREGFCKFCKVINPHFVVPSRSTTTREFYSFFIDERKKLSNIFQNLSSRVCLTTDTWTSVGHTGVLIGRAVETCLTEWGLKNILIVTVDNASSNDVAINHLIKVLNHWDCGVLKGAFLHMRCAAHVLNLVVRDGLMEVNSCVKKIRALVKYVRSSPARLQKFKASMQEEKIESKSLVPMDVDTRWNSTFLMLKSAIKFRKAFSNLLLKDSNCAKELKKCEGGLISDEDWVNVSSLLPFLKIFYDATKRFSGSRYVTSNAYIHDIFGIGNVIDGVTKHVDESIKSMALKMQIKYKKYWGDVEKLNQFLFIGVVLDPRRKWQYIVWVMEENFGKERAESFLSKLDFNMRALFNLYNSSMPQKEKDEEVSSTTTNASPSSMWGHEVVMDIEELMTKRFEMAMGSSETILKKTELDKYLSEDREPMDVNFDILTWWKVQQCRYPILAKMAHDMLAIPISMVASESAFSNGGRVLDDFRTCLTSKMVEALVCTQDWVRESHEPININDILLEVEKMEDEGLKDLTMEQPTIIIDETVDELTERLDEWGFSDL
ncbi:unnamed protein product [Lactuca saligna]|uniref:Zinc finger BED domain-containing protein RICESLEEPER 2-like n=1 Tax=Lactuca saligna TaxID=75948 RepID=A0AA35ZGA7_LACSI|nr:unnamed protein product [Lactuca saligna]